MHQVRFKWLILPLTALLSFALLLSACGSTSNAGTGGNKTITVGSKMDPDGELQGEMYILLLQKHGYKVTPKLGLSSTDIAHNAIVSGSIDLYPEFTGTGLSLVDSTGISTADPQAVYNAVKTGFESKFQITWLDPAYGLNDDYGLCTTQANATKYKLQNISDVTAVASQLTLTAASDAISDKTVVPAMESVYNLHFKNTVQVTEPLSFSAVSGGQADLNICYTTDPAIVTNNFVLLKDDKNAFPVFNPAPIVRDSVLSAHPDIKDILNPLATKLTTENITAAIKSYSVDKKPVDVVAQQLLQQLGLL